MTVQFIEQNGTKQYAIIPADTYALLLEKAEMLDDIKTYDEAMANDDELVPSEVVERLIAGENKIKVWREYRGLSQSVLAEKANMAQASIAQMEAGKRIGSITVLKKISKALQLDLDDLV
jgi:DNA-binding XRE family transcriptional regulator